jgi:hypothetical protein
VIVFEVDTNIWKEQATSVFNAEMLLAGNWVVYVQRKLVTQPMSMEMELDQDHWQW